jgi:plastocyanin
LKERRSGISALLGLLVVVIIIGGIFFVEIPMVSKTTSTTTMVSSSSSSTSAVSSASAPSTGTLTFKIPQPMVVAPDENESVLLAFSAVGTVNGNYSLSAAGLPTGVSASFSPSTVSFPADLTNTVTITLSAASGATIANASSSIVATAGSSVYKQQFPVQSVGGLVIIQGNQFTPSSLTVSSGTKVYWLDLDAVGSEASGGAVGHDVTAINGLFSSGKGNLVQYDEYGYMFTTSGTVSYESQAQPSMTGQIIVTG